MQVDKSCQHDRTRTRCIALDFPNIISCFNNANSMFCTSHSLIFSPCSFFPLVGSQIFSLNYRTRISQNVILRYGV